MKPQQGLESKLDEDLEAWFARGKNAPSSATGTFYDVAQQG